jgi:hypothetical protein
VTPVQEEPAVLEIDVRPAGERRGDVIPARTELPDFRRQESVFVGCKWGCGEGRHEVVVPSLTALTRIATGDIGGDLLPVLVTIETDKISEFGIFVLSELGTGSGRGRRSTRHREMGVPAQNFSQKLSPLQYARKSLQIPDVRIDIGTILPGQQFLSGYGDRPRWYNVIYSKTPAICEGPGGLPKSDSIARLFPNDPTFRFVNHPKPRF